jgi:hypothetical protein
MIQAVVRESPEPLPIQTYNFFPHFDLEDKVITLEGSVMDNVQRDVTD